MKANQPKIIKVQKALSKFTQSPINFDHENLAKTEYSNTS